MIMRAVTHYDKTLMEDNMEHSMQDLEKAVDKVAAEKRWVYGTHSDKWHLVGPDDRDFDYGITTRQLNDLGKEKARVLYLQSSIYK